MRSIPGKKQAASSGDKPDIAKILDYYGVRYVHKDTQKCRCPIHDDSAPSMSVDFRKQLWRCHGCQTGGDAITMVELKEGLAFPEALARVEEITGQKVSGSGSGAQSGPTIKRVKRGRGVRPKLGGGGTRRPSF